MTRAVFVDANILIAGSVSRSGASRAVLGLAEAGMYGLVVSRQVLNEAERNIKAKFPAILPILAELLSYIPLNIVDDPHHDDLARWFTIIEEKDASILEAAVRAAPDYFLSLNTKDFTPAVAAATGLNIQTPGEFIQRARQLLDQGL